MLIKGWLSEDKVTSIHTPPAPDVLPTTRRPWLGRGSPRRELEDEGPSSLIQGPTKQEPGGQVGFQTQERSSTDQRWSEQELQRSGS